MWNVLSRPPLPHPLVFRVLRTKARGLSEKQGAEGCPKVDRSGVIGPAKAVEMPDDGFLIGGREKRSIVLDDWDPSWSKRFEQERQRISSALGGLARRIEHVGSTSVTGLAAKPIIDIQLSVSDVDEENSYVSPMEAAGYVLRVREPGHRMFRTPSLDVHIHVCDAGSDWERRHLVFRDWLRRSPEDRARYEAAKRLLVVSDWEDITRRGKGRVTRQDLACRHTFGAQGPVHRVRLA